MQTHVWCDNRLVEREIYVNPAEDAFVQLARSKGWNITKRGWPDFFCEKDGQVICVEVKPKATSGLKIDQHRVTQALVASGIRCYKWTPENGGTLIKVGDERRPHRPRKPPKLKALVPEILHPVRIHIAD